MKLTLTDAFVREVRALDDAERAAAFDALLGLRAALATPHTHAGLGLRKLHRSGIYEVRVGLRLRLVFALARDEAILVRIADHDEVRRYLRTL
jgi:plasmid maintenance system killer protein